MDQITQDIQQGARDWREASSEIRQIRERIAVLKGHERRAKPKVMRMLKEVSEEASHQADLIDSLLD